MEQDRVDAWDLGPGTWDLGPGTWEDKFKEAFTSLFVKGNESMKDPKMKLTAKI
jgi:hypothetical protein